MIETTMPLTYLGTYSDTLKLGYSTSVPTGCYIQRNSLSDASHYSETDPIVYHPTHSFIVENRNLHHFLTGRWEFCWEWVAGDFTSEQIDTFISVAELDTNPSISSIVKTDTKLTIIHEGISTTLTEWTHVPFEWSLASPIAGMKSLLDGSTIFCCTILNNEYSLHTVQSIDIPAGNTLPLQKSGTDYCYLFFNKEVTNYDTNSPLLPFKTYKLASPSITVTNTGAENVRVLRISK